MWINIPVTFKNSEHMWGMKLWRELEIFVHASKSPRHPTPIIQGWTTWIFSKNQTWPKPQQSSSSLIRLWKTDPKKYMMPKMVLKNVCFHVIYHARIPKKITLPFFHEFRSFPCQNPSSDPHLPASFKRLGLLLQGFRIPVINGRR